VDAAFCTGFPTLDSEQLQELTRYGAQAGNPSALDRVVGQHEAAGDVVSAYAWLIYQRWVMASGCSPMSMLGDFAVVTRHGAQLEARLRPADVAAGRAEANRLIAAHGAQMRAAFACPP
jgi:hypothetical protein